MRIEEANILKDAIEELSRCVPIGPHLFSLLRLIDGLTDLPMISYTESVPHQFQEIFAKNIGEILA